MTDHDNSQAVEQTNNLIRGDKGGVNNPFAYIEYEHYALDASEPETAVDQEPVDDEAPAPAPAPAPVQATASTVELDADDDQDAMTPIRRTRDLNAVSDTRPDGHRLSRASDYKSYYARISIELALAEERLAARHQQVLELEERLAGGGLKAMLDRCDQVLDRAQRVENSVTLATDMLGQQARLIAKAFHAQLKENESDGQATLKKRLHDVSEEVAAKAAKALNQLADESAVYAGAQAEASARQRITEAVIEQAKASGLERSVLVLVNAVGRIQDAAARLEQTPQAAPREEQEQPRQKKKPAREEPILSFSERFDLWYIEHFGRPGTFITIAGVALAIYVLFF